MALTLTEQAKLTQNPLQRGVMETFIMESPVLDRLPLLPIQGNSLSYNEEATLPGIEFRAVNASYTESTGTVNQKSESLVILGGMADVDRFLVQTQGNLNDLRAGVTRGKIKASVYKFQDTFINGDTGVDANSFDGLKKRLTGSQVISAGTNGLPVIGSSDSDRHAFFDALDTLLAAVRGGADALYMNATILAKIRGAARRLTMYAETRDNFGRLVSTYQGVPMFDIGQKADGSLIIPQTETQGSSSVASSIYAVHFGRDITDQAVTGITNGGIMVDDLGLISDKPVYRTLIEFYCGLAIFGGYAAARLKGVLAS